ncbi:MAG: PAS domain S-box protein [Nitrosomonadales bacterium]|nr:PAS domain S-box protein [Nitrosomonadales bacterium]
MNLLMQGGDEQIQRLILDSMAEAVVVADAEGRVLKFNKAAERLHGMGLSEGLPDGWGARYGIFLPDEVTPCAPGEIPLARVLRGELPDSVELYVKRPDGSGSAVSVTGRPILGEQGQIIGGVVVFTDISVQRRMEREHLASEALLRKVLDALPVGVSTADREGRITHGNPASRRIWGGVDCAGLNGQFKGWRALSGKRIEPGERALARALSQGATVLGEVVEIECADGTHKIILNSAVPLRDTAHQVCGVIVIDEDITERYHAQETVRVNREFFQSVFDSAAVGMALCDPRGRFLGVNQALCRTFGYSDEEMLAMSVQDITHPDDREISESSLQRVLQGDSPSFQLEKRYRHKSGADLWALVAVALVRDAHGAPLYFIGQVLDITARKEAENRLRESEASLASAQAQANLGSWWLDIQHNVLNWSDENYRIFGVEKGTPLNYQTFLDCVHPSDVEKVDRAWQAGMRGEPYDIQHRIQMKGRVKWVRERAELEFDAEGRLVRGVGTTQDITELKKHEEALLHSKERLRKLAAHQELIREEERAHIAREVHDELGQLLTALKMDVSLLRLRFGDVPNLLEHADGMRQLVEKTISVVRHVASNLRPAALNLGIVPALEWLAEDFTHHSGVKCELVIQDMDVALDDMQATTVFRVMQESLTNVARHAQASKVEIRLWRRGRSLHLKVQDNGRGFDSANRRRNTFGLLGIRERVLMLDGTIKINNTPGTGACVSISIPLIERGSKK